MPTLWDVLSWISTGFVTVLLVSTASCSGESVSACFNSTQKSLQISCGSGYMLRIRKAFYGYSYSGQCSFNPGDCTQLEHESYPCIGRDYCSINLPSGNYGQRIPFCEKYSTYFQVEYTCEPVIQTTDICQSTILTSQSGYIATPRYPSNYRDNTDCLTRIRVHPSQKINLTIIDMDLEINGTYGCHDWMYAYDQFLSVTLCGRRGNERLNSLQSNEISIKFQSDKQGNKKGFWLFYEAYPPLPSTTVPTTPKRTQAPTDPPTQRPSQTQNRPSKSVTIPVTKHTQTVNSTSEEKLPFAAIVGGVIGTLTFILIILLILLAMKWWREKKQTVYKRSPKDVEFLDARNPAFRSSSGSEFQGVELYYNC